MNTETLSRRQLAVRAFRRNRLARVSLWLLMVLVTISIFAEFFAPYSPQERNRAYPDGPPMGVDVITPEGQLALHVAARVNSRDPVTLRRIVSIDEENIWPIRFFVRGQQYSWFGLFESDRRLFGVPDGYVHLFGTDQLGRDIFSRTLYAFRTSLSVGAVSVIVAFVLGIVIGGLAGYLRGFFDTVSMRVVEFLQSIPTLPLWLTVAAAVPREWTAIQTYLIMTVILALIAVTYVPAVSMTLPNLFGGA